MGVTGYYAKAANKFRNILLDVTIPNRQLPSYANAPNLRKKIKKFEIYSYSTHGVHINDLKGLYYFDSAVLLNVFSG